MSVVNYLGTGSVVDNDREHMYYSSAMLRILAVDPLRPVLGVCRLWGDLGDVTFRCETLPLRDHGPERLGQFALWLRDVLAAEAPALTMIRGIEEADAERMAMGAEIGGVLRFLLLEAGRETLLVPPPSLRLWACGDPNARPDEVAFAALRRFGPLVSAPEQAEAAWLAEIGYHLQAGLEGSTDLRRRLLRKLRMNRREIPTLSGVCGNKELV